MTRDARLYAIVKGASHSVVERASLDSIPRRQNQVYWTIGQKNTLLTNF